MTDRMRIEWVKGGDTEMSRYCGKTEVKVGGKRGKATSKWPGFGEVMTGG